ncbi:MAG: metallophosphoesterase [bacterium]
MKNILVISDLHIGNGDIFDTFGWDDKEFISSLEIIKKEEKIDLVIFNGDVFELYKYTWNQIYEKRKKLIDYFIDSKYILIKGNHDAISPIGQNSWEYKNTDNKIIKIEHGHAADFMSGRKWGRKLQRFGFKLLKKISNLKWFKKIYMKYVEIDDYIHHIPKKYHTYRYLKYALFRLKKTDFLILGHTHKIEEHKIYYLNNKKIYLNSGTCQLGRFQGLVINLEKLNYNSIKFKNYLDLISNYK